MTQATEIVLMWIAVTLYAAASVLFVVGWVFRKERLVDLGFAVALSGLIPHAIAIVGRWGRVGHGPYLGFYEVVSSYAFLAVVFFGVICWRYRGLRPIGVGVLPAAFLLLGWAMFAGKSAMPISAKLASWWLTIHVTLAKLSYASLIAATALAIVYLLKERRGTAEESSSGSWASILAKLPSNDIIDDLTFKFVSVGFLFLGMMIAAGAIWANEAWGRYWAWDPVETWSLVCWLTYAVVLHLRLTMGWRGRRFAWATIAALSTMIFASLGVPLVYNSIHAAYLSGF